MSRDYNGEVTWIVESEQKNSNHITPNLPALKNMMTI